MVGGMKRGPGLGVGSGNPLYRGDLKFTTFSVRPYLMPC